MRRFAVRVKALIKRGGPLKQIRRAVGAVLKESQLRSEIEALTWNGFRPGMNLANNPLCSTAGSYWSQANEDGILEAILSRLDVPRHFLEIGVGNGLENNTVYLLSLGWSGVWIGDEELAFRVLPEDPIRYLRHRVELENLLPVLNEAVGDVESPIGVVSIDVDGNDYHFAEMILEAGLRPSVWIVEYNGRFPVGCEWVMPYAADHRWDGSDYFGASLSSLNLLLTRYGYLLVACSAQGSNAFFVGDAHADRFADCPSDEVDIYRPPIYRYPERLGHRVDPRTIEHILRMDRKPTSNGIQA